MKHTSDFRWQYRYIMTLAGCWGFCNKMVPLNRGIIANEQYQGTKKPRVNVGGVLKTKEVPFFTQGFG